MKNLNLSLVSKAGESEINEEKRFPLLNSLGMVRAINPLDQWYILVNEAWTASKLPMNEVVRDYLVTMLNRFMCRIDLLEQLAIFDYVQHVLNLKKVVDEGVQDVADMSLQYVALYSERSVYRHEPRSLEYSASIGIELYQQLAKDSVAKDDWFSMAFREMANFFGLAVIILRSMNPRYGLGRTIVQESGKTKLLFDTDFSANKIRKAYKHFEGMYLVQQPEGSNYKN